MKIAAATDADLTHRGWFLFVPMWLGTAPNGDFGGVPRHWSLWGLLLLALIVDRIISAASVLVTGEDTIPTWFITGPR